MKISIIGAGAVGSIIASFISPQLDVIVYGRTPRPLKINKDGILNELRISVVPLNEKTVQKSDIIFVTTKAIHLNQIMPYVEQMIHDDTIIIICQNGYSQTARFKHEKTYHAVVYISGQKINDTVIHFQDNTLILPINEETMKLKTVFQSTALNIELSKEYQAKLWMKLLVNLGINSVTALTLNTAQVLNDEDMLSFTKALLQEGFNVAQSEGILLNTTIDEIINIYLTYDAKMGTSMYYDRINLQPTEYEFIQGYIQYIAKKNNVTTPYIDTVTLLLKGYQNRFND